MTDFLLGHVKNAVLSMAIVLTGIATCANAQQPPVDNARIVQFSFDGTPWREVIKWLATEGNFALHVGDLPTGSFTYSDNGKYTLDQAISRVNLFLVPQGFTLIRSGRLLSVINMSDPRSLQQLDAMVDFVKTDALKTRNKFDVVKCIFKLDDEIEADEAVQELSTLNLMITPAILERTNQLIITETVSKLQKVQAVLEAFDSKNPDVPVVDSFELKHSTAEEVLTAVRPHIGLATGEFIGIDISLSADPLGQKIFVTGLEDKVKLLKSLIEQVDKPDESDEDFIEPSIVQSHEVKGGNLKTVYDVLQTLMSGKKTIRISMDEDSDAIVALAPPKIQAQIASTVEEIQGSRESFKVIQLRTADPFVVVSLLEEMMDLPDPLDDPKDVDPDAPKIDADPANMRLYVRGKKSKIEEIEEIVEGLDSATNGSVDENSTMRLLPLKGDDARRVLESAVKFWRESNPVVFYDADPAEEAVGERVIGEAPKPKPDVIKKTKLLPPPVTLTSTSSVSKAPVIRCQLTSRGLIIQSEDTKALDRFEEHIRMIAGPMDSNPSKPIVFYLKYTKADDAIRMLAELIDGGDTVESETGSSLVNGFVSSAGDSFFGSLLLSREGTMTLTIDSMTVVSDSRLNRLIAQGTVSEIDRIEGYLEIIDRDKSITDIETYGKSHIIELQNARASEVADVVREAYASRVAKGTPTAAATPAKPGQKPQPGQGDPRQAQAGDKSKKQQPQPKRQPTKNLEPTMTVTVHEASNSLIITAPDQLFADVEKLVMSIDSKAEQAVEVIAPVNAELYGTLIEQIMTGESRNPGPSNSGARSSSNAAGRKDR